MYVQLWLSHWKRHSFTVKIESYFLNSFVFVLFWRRNTCVGYIFSSSFDRQQQERQGQPGVFLLWLHRLLCGPGTDRFGDAHFQGCPTCPSVFGACLSRNTDHAGPHKRRNFRVVQVSWKYFTLLLLFVFCLSLFKTPKLKVGHSLFQSLRVLKEFCQLGINTLFRLQDSHGKTM